MDRHADADARGLAALAVLLLISLAPGARPDPPSVETPEALLAALPGDVPPRRRVALGLPVPCGTTDPRVFEALPGVGPARGRALAEAARAGALRGPEDLLRIPGFGSKMAARIAPRLGACPPASESP